ncbi:MAG TPA: metallophosphoesterase [Planctomycetota bacterium]|nr:metallophosphoesterase [Planctomycetota bacterium]
MSISLPRFSAATVVLCVAGAVYAGIAQWDFEGTLGASTENEPLVVAAASPASTPDLSFTSVQIAGGTAGVAHFSRGTHFILTHGFAPNGGGRNLNQYTLVMDVMFPNRAPSGGWAALLQTDPNNTSDGDWFVNPDGGVGISSNYGGSVPDGEWHRLALVVDLVAGSFTSFIDGVRVQQNLGEARDGRFSAGPVIRIFADENRENAEGFVNSLQLRDVALPDHEVAALGAASAGGISPTVTRPPAPAGLWEFGDPANLTAATAGRDLVLAGSHVAVEGVVPGDGAARIGIGSHYRCTHGLPPGEHPLVNRYAFLIDFRVPAHGPWHCFFQTDQENLNDGECFIRTDGAIGAAATGYSPAGSVAAGVWYRLCVSVDNPAGVYELLLDGERVLKGVAQPANGRFALGPDVLFCADEDGEDGLIDVSTIAVYDRPLTAAEALSLGGPGAFDPANRAPSVVSAPAGPSRVVRQETHEFTFRALDEDGDLIQVRIDWGDGVVTPWSPFQDTAEPFVLEHAYNRTDYLPIRAQARDEHGATSPWAFVQHIHVAGDIFLAFVTPPYLQNVRTDRITVMWELDGDTECVVEYGTAGARDRSAEAVSQPVSATSYVYRAVLDGLQPDTTYDYRVTGFDVPAVEGRFKTAPVEAAPFSFAVWSDSQGTNHGTYLPDPYEPTKAMFAHMAQVGVDFAVSAGDIAESGEDYTGVHAYYLDRIVPALGPVAPWFIAWGNHDRGQTAVIRKFADHPSGEREGFDPGWGSFSFDYAQCHFVCIDYNTATADILTWLEGDLQAAVRRRVRFTFLFIHVPPYCEIWIDGNAQLRATLVPLLERYGVDACFSGHTHEYERGFLGGTYYCVTGGGSWLDHTEPYTVDWPHMTVGGFHSLGNGIDKGLVNEYVQVIVDGDVAECRMQAFYPDGTWRGTLDTFTIDRCGNGNGPADDLNGNGIPDSCEGGGQLPGDCNQDGKLDISDVVCLLGFLFVHDPETLPCGDGTAEDAANLALISANGDEQIDIADAVYLLQRLFANGPPHVLGAACTPIPDCPATCVP